MDPLQPPRQGEAIKVDTGPSEVRMEREYNPNPNVREAGGAEARTWDEQLPSGRQSTGYSSHMESSGTYVSGAPQFPGDETGEGGGQYYAPRSTEYGRMTEGGKGGLTSPGQQAGGGEQYEGDDVGKGKGQYYAPDSSEYGRLGKE